MYVDISLLLSITSMITTCSVPSARFRASLTHAGCPYPLHTHALLHWVCGGGGGEGGGLGGGVNK